MTTAIALFSNYNVTNSTVDAGRVVQSQNLDWISIQVSVTAVAGINPRAEFRLQWSFDNVTWSDSSPKDIIGVSTTPGSFIQRFSIKAPYWRVAAEITGTNPVFTCTANALS